MILDGNLRLAWWAATIWLRCGCAEFEVQGEPLEQLEQTVVTPRLPSALSAEPPERQV